MSELAYLVLSCSRAVLRHSWSLGSTEWSSSLLVCNTGTVLPSTWSCMFGTLSPWKRLPPASNKGLVATDQVAWMLYVREVDPTHICKGPGPRAGFTSEFKVIHVPKLVGSGTIIIQLFGLYKGSILQYYIHHYTTKYELLTLQHEIWHVH